MSDLAQLRGFVEQMSRFKTPYDDDIRQELAEESELCGEDPAGVDDCDLIDCYENKRDDAAYEDAVCLWSMVRQARDLLKEIEDRRIASLAQNNACCETAPITIGLPETFSPFSLTAVSRPTET